jgi:hypothetical protein
MLRLAGYSWGTINLSNGIPDYGENIIVIGKAKK